MLEGIRRLLAERQRRRSLSVIREEFAFWGYPLDDLTDEEIEERVVEAGRALANTGLTAAEATAALRQVLGLLSPDLRYLAQNVYMPPRI